jgi:hypothetical protein
MEEGLNEDEEFADKEQGVDHDLRRIFARQRQQLPCNLQYDFNLLLLALMSFVIFLLKPLFAVMGYLWRTWQRTFLPDHTSTFDFLVGASVMLLYAVWLPILLAMGGVAAAATLSGLVYWFRRCCVPVVEELEIDRNIQKLQRRLTIATSAPPAGLSSGSSTSFLSSYAIRPSPSRGEDSWLPPEESLITPHELLVLPLLIAGEGILTIRV